MKKLNILLLLCVVGAGCGKNNDSQPPAPVPAVLNFPLQNATCTTGTTLSGTQSSVTFKWGTAANADSYEVDLKNLLTGTITAQTSTSNQLAVTLEVNTPYSWFVVSKSSVNTTTAKSDTWKFYNSGPGVVSYAPFPADNLSPAQGQKADAVNGSVNLSWTGSDPDNDIATYDVYFGTNPAPGLFKEKITPNALNGVTVTSGTTYYWKVITTDSKLNTSDSGVYQFTVK